MFFIFLTIIIFTNDLNLHLVSFLFLNLFGIDFYNFIIAILCFFEVYGAKYRFDIKSPDKFNWFSFICFYNHFCGLIHSLIENYTMDFFCTQKSRINLYNFIIITLCFLCWPIINFYILFSWFSDLLLFFSKLSKPLSLFLNLIFPFGLFYFSIHLLQGQYTLWLV